MFSTHTLDTLCVGGGGAVSALCALVFVLHACVARIL